MPEVKVDLDADGRVAGRPRGARTPRATRSSRSSCWRPTRRWPRLLRDKGLPFLRRIHESPSPHKLRALTDSSASWACRPTSLQGRFELQSCSDEVKGRPEQHAVNYAVLRAMQRAVYSPQGRRPLRPGQRLLLPLHLAHPPLSRPDGPPPAGRPSRRPQAPQQSATTWSLLGQHCSDREQRAEAAERDLTKLKLLAYLSDRIGLEMDAIVTGVESFGLFVQGIELPAEGLIHADALADDYYSFDRADAHAHRPPPGNRYRLGDLLRVVVARVDLERRELDFRLVERGRHPRPGQEAVPCTRAEHACAKRKTVPKGGDAQCRTELRRIRLRTKS